MQKIFRLIMTFTALIGLQTGCTPDQNINALEPKLTFSPAEIEVGEVVVDYTGTASLEVINAGRASLDIFEMNFSGANPGVFSAEPSEFRLSADERQEVIISFTPSTYRLYADELTITSDDPDNPATIIPVAGEGVHAPTPDINVDPITLDFETVAPLTGSTLWFTISNIGDGPLNILASEQTGSANFSVITDPAGMTIESESDTATVVVVYTPQSIDGDAGSLILQTDDPDEQEVTIHFLGNGGGDFDYPVAVINGPATAAPLDTIYLSGESSYDPEGYALTTYEWTLTHTPTGSTTSLDDTSSDTSSLFLDLAGEWEVQLQVWNEIGLGSAPVKYNVDAIPEDRIHIELIWDTQNSDLDLHLAETPSVEFFDMPGDCSYCNPTPSWGASGSSDDPRLDLDDIMGFGPENINIDEPYSGEYPIRVHYFEDHGAGSTTATVKVYIDGELSDQLSNVIGRDEVWDVGNVLWPSGLVAEENTSNYTAPARSCF